MDRDDGFLSLEPSRAEVSGFGRFGGDGGRMLTLFDEETGFLADPAGLLRHTEGLDDWM